MSFNVQASELFSAANQTASEAFAAIRTVAAFSLQAPLGALYEKLLEKPQARTGFPFACSLLNSLQLETKYSQCMKTSPLSHTLQILNKAEPDPCVPGVSI